MADDMAERERSLSHRVPDVNLIGRESTYLDVDPDRARGAVDEILARRRLQIRALGIISITGGLFMGTVGGLTLLGQLEQAASQTEPIPVVSPQTRINPEQTRTVGGLALAETPTTAPTATKIPASAIARPDGISPEIWKKLSEQDKKKLAENTARIRGNDEIRAGLATSVSITPEAGGIRKEDIDRANREAAEPPPPPPKPGGPLIPDTGIGFIDAPIHSINWAWDVAKILAGVGVLFAIFKLVPKIPKLAWELIKLPFKVAAAAIRFISRLFKGGPPSSGGRDDRDDYMTSGGS